MAGGRGRVDSGECYFRLMAGGAQAMRVYWGQRLCGNSDSVTFKLFWDYFNEKCYHLSST